MAEGYRLQSDAQVGVAGVLPALATHADLSRGEHPALIAAYPELAALPAFPSPELMSALPALQVPVRASHTGHHMVEDAGYLTALGEPRTDAWPLAPLFVRDLAGRILHTGLNPLPANTTHPRPPAGCTLVDVGNPLLEQLEQVFLTSFRLLEFGYATGTALSGRSNVQVHAIYPAPQAYPYKIRPDTFYQDGFRLPQTTRLYAKPAEAGQAQAAARELVEKWERRTAGQSYEAFYEANDGTVWFAGLFGRGCTVIPTFEAFNGVFKVTEDFGMADVWPGRAVEGLHEVTEKRPDASPAGTILQVVAPGFVTATDCVPAKVVVSDGSGYVSPHAGNPQPLVPDARLPHPRLGGASLGVRWADVWLPTHPRHFESPALWNWSPEGFFQQVAGPLWDPLHYTYASTSRILKAFRRPAEGLPPVPEDMRPRFHPVTELKAYDTLSTTTRQHRQATGVAAPLGESGLDAVPLGRVVAAIGYHPLPAALEYELDPFALPKLDPRHRGTPACPPDVAPRLAPVATSSVTADEAKKLLAVTDETERQFILKPEFWPQVGAGVAGYPQLLRYLAPHQPDDVQAALTPCYVPDVPVSTLMIGVKRMFASKSYRQSLAALGGGLAESLYRFREEALAWRRLRHRLVRKYPGWYVRVWWHNHTPAEFEETWQAEPEFNLLAAEKALAHQQGAATFLATEAAQTTRARLPVGAGSAKLGQVALNPSPGAARPAQPETYQDA